MRGGSPVGDCGVQAAPGLETSSCPSRLTRLTLRAPPRKPDTKRGFAAHENISLGIGCGKAASALREPGIGNPESVGSRVPRDRHQWKIGCGLRRDGVIAPYWDIVASVANYQFPATNPHFRVGNI